VGHNAPHLQAGFANKRIAHQNFLEPKNTMQSRGLRVLLYTLRSITTTMALIDCHEALQWEKLCVKEERKGSFVEGFL
jgi:hypothetical protein